MLTPSSSWNHLSLVDASVKDGAGPPDAALPNVPHFFRSSAENHEASVDASNVSALDSLFVLVVLRRLTLIGDRRVGAGLDWQEIATLLSVRGVMIMGGGVSVGSTGSCRNTPYFLFSLH